MGAEVVGDAVAQVGAIHVIGDQAPPFVLGHAEHLLLFVEFQRVGLFLPLPGGVAAAADRYGDLCEILETVAAVDAERSRDPMFLVGDRGLRVDPHDRRIGRRAHDDRFASQRFVCGAQRAEKFPVRALVCDAHLVGARRRVRFSGRVERKVLRRLSGLGVGQAERRGNHLRVGGSDPQRYRSRAVLRKFGLVAQESDALGHGRILRIVRFDRGESRFLLRTGDDERQNREARTQQREFHAIRVIS